MTFRNFQVGDPLKMQMLLKAFLIALKVLHFKCCRNFTTQSYEMPREQVPSQILILHSLLEFFFHKQSYLTVVMQSKKNTLVFF